MYKAIKFAFMIGLILAVAILGIKINHKSSAVKSELTKDKTEVAKKIANLEHDAEKKAKSLGIIMQNFQNSIDEKFAQTNKKDTTKTSQMARKSEKGGNSDTKVPLNPMDAEDQELTAEILKEKSSGTKPLPSIQEVSAESLDMERVAEIQDIYSKASRILELD